MTDFKRTLYRIKFINEGELYEIYTEYFAESEMLGFIELEGFVFNTKTQIVVDPSEERLKNEFQSVKRCYIPVQAIIRIDEVEKPGMAKITNLEGGLSNVSTFPVRLSRKSAKKEIDN